MMIMMLLILWLFCFCGDDRVVIVSVVPIHHHERSTTAPRRVKSALVRVDGERIADLAVDAIFGGAELGLRERLVVREVEAELLVVAQRT